MSNACRCENNIVCNNHWTVKHTNKYKLQKTKKGKNDK